MTNKGTVFVVSGPSGVGKDTILEGVFKLRPQIEFSRSCITRPMRPGETADGKYRFITKQEFLSMLENDQLLEHNEFVGNLYGTPRGPVEDCVNRGASIIIEVDVNGAASIKAKLPECVRIFIAPPSIEILKQRLCGRKSDSQEAVQKRLDTALEELKHADSYDYVIVNDNLENAIKQFCEIVDKVNSK